MSYNTHRTQTKDAEMESIYYEGAFPYTFDAPYIGTQDFEVDVKYEFDSGGDLQRFSCLYKGIDIEPILQHLDSYGDLVEKIKEEIEKDLISIKGDANE